MATRGGMQLQMDFVSVDMTGWFMLGQQASFSAGCHFLGWIEHHATLNCNMQPDGC